MDNAFAEQLREVNEALLLSSIRQHELVGQLQQALAELAEQDRRKDEFPSILAHGLRIPLAPLTSGLQLISMASGEPAFARTHSRHDGPPIGAHGSAG